MHWPHCVLSEQEASPIPTLLAPARRRKVAMTTHSHTAPSWSTSSGADLADTSPMDLDVLRAHLIQCTTRPGHWFAVRRTSRWAQGFLVTRLASTVLAVVVLLGLAAAVL